VSEVGSTEWSEETSRCVVSHPLNFVDGVISGAYSLSTDRSAVVSRQKEAIDGLSGDLPPVVQSRKILKCLEDAG
jgi:hypothetical protein